MDDPKYNRIVLERMLSLSLSLSFKPFPASYYTLATAETIKILIEVMSNVTQRKPFHMWKDPEFEPDYKTFILKIMKLDPRDRPTAEELLKDTWISTS